MSSLVGRLVARSLAGQAPEGAADVGMVRPRPRSRFEPAPAGGEAAGPVQAVADLPAADTTRPAPVDDLLGWLRAQHVTGADANPSGAAAPAPATGWLVPVPVPVSVPVPAQATPGPAPTGTADRVTAGPATIPGADERSVTPAARTRAAAGHPGREGNVPRPVVAEERPGGEARPGREALGGTLRDALPAPRGEAARGRPDADLPGARRPVTDGSLGTMIRPRDVAATPRPTPSTPEAPGRRGRARDAVGRGEAAPRVEVRIGRVEVRAVHAPATGDGMAAAEAPRPRPGPATSLEDYLSQRERGT